MYGKDPRYAAEKAAQRSELPYQLGAAIFNPKNFQVEKIGWNHLMPDNLRLSCFSTWHAELHAIMRAGIGRSNGRALAVFGRARKSGNRILAKPCLLCQALCVEAGIKYVLYSDKSPQGWATMKF